MRRTVTMLEIVVLIMVCEAKQGSFSNSEEHIIVWADLINP